MKTNIDFANGKTGRSLIKMFFPIFAATVLMLAYTLVDSIWVGNLLGETGYAALTTAGSISLILYAFTTGIGNGTCLLHDHLYHNSEALRYGESEPLHGAYVYLLHSDKDPPCFSPYPQLLRS